MQSAWRNPGECAYLTYPKLNRTRRNHTQTRSNCIHRSQFEVYTTIAYLPEKIDNLPAYIASLQEDHITSGVIKMLEVEYHAPFEPNEESKNEANNASGQKAGGNTPSPTPDSNKDGGKTSPKPTPKPTPKSPPKETARPS